MPALLPIILTGSYLVLAADQIPQLNFEPSCRAAASTSQDRNAEACKRDELTARDKLKEQWGQYTPAQRTRCVSLSRLGGFPSYVELLTAWKWPRTPTSPAPRPAAARNSAQGFLPGGVL